MATNGGGGCWTVSAIVAVPTRFSASVMVTGRLLVPSATAAGTVARNEYVRSPLTASPFDPLSNMVCVAEPPTAERSTLTDAIGADGMPMVAAVVSKDCWPARIAAGVAAPTPVGPVLPQTLTGDAEFLGFGVPVEKSALLLSVSVQPAPDLTAAVVFESAGVAAVSKQFAPS